jgi:hypothetical protein
MTANMGPLVTSPFARMFLVLCRIPVLIVALVSLFSAAENHMGMPGLVPTAVFWAVWWCIGAILKGRR